MAKRNRLTAKQIASWTGPKPGDGRPKKVLPDVFREGQVFKSSLLLVYVYRVSGRGKHRAIHAARFVAGVRTVDHYTPGQLRDLLEGRRCLPRLAKAARFCRCCGCTDDDCRHCVALTGKPCEWKDWDEPDLCSACDEERLPAAHEDGVVSHVGGSPIDANPFKPVRELPNDLYEHWRKGWTDDERQTQKDAAIAQGNARALASLGAVISAAKKVGLA